MLAGRNVAKLLIEQKADLCVKDQLGFSGGSAMHVRSDEHERAARGSKMARVCRCLATHPLTCAALIANCWLPDASSRQTMSGVRSRLLAMMLRH